MISPTPHSDFPTLPWCGKPQDGSAFCSFKSPPLYFICMVQYSLISWTNPLHYAVCCQSTMKIIKLNLREISQTLNQKKCWKISCKYFCILWIIYHLLYLHSLSMLMNTRLFLCTVMAVRVVALMLHSLFLSSCHLWIFTLMTHDESDQSSSMKNKTKEVKCWCLQPPQHKPQKIKTEGFSASPGSFFKEYKKCICKCKFNQKILPRTNVCTCVV